MKNNKIVKEIAGVVLSYLKKNNKEELLGEIISYLKDQEKSNAAVVVTPRKLTNAERLEIRSLFIKLTGEVPGNINYQEDEMLIDGIKVTYKDKLFDLSLSKQISSLVKN